MLSLSIPLAQPSPFLFVQLSASRVDTSPIHASVFPSAGNHPLSMTAFNSASNVTASLLVAVVVADNDDDLEAADDVTPARLIHAPFSISGAPVNFTLRSLPVEAKRVLFVTSR